MVLNWTVQVHVHVYVWYNIYSIHTCTCTCGNIERGRAQYAILLCTEMYTCYIQTKCWECPKYPQNFKTVNTQSYVSSWAMEYKLIHFLPCTCEPMLPSGCIHGIGLFTSCHNTQTSVYYIFGVFFFTDSVEEDKMLAEGVSRFCDDANLDPTSLTVLILAWKFKAATQCEFSRKEFVEGMAELG